MRCPPPLLSLSSPLLFSSFFTSFVVSICRYNNVGNPFCDCLRTDNSLWGRPRLLLRGIGGTRLRGRKGGRGTYAKVRPLTSKRRLHPPPPPPLAWKKLFNSSICCCLSILVQCALALCNHYTELYLLPSLIGRLHCCCCKTFYAYNSNNNKSKGGEIFS